jgi:hypothetical protein
LVEHSLGKGEVISSILIIGSRVWKFEEQFGKARLLAVPLRVRDRAALAAEVLLKADG